MESIEVKVFIETRELLQRLITTYCAGGYKLAGLAPASIHHGSVSTYTVVFTKSTEGD